MTPQTVPFCPHHGDPMIFCRDSLEWICGECSHEYAVEQYHRATDEALATLADEPERIDLNQLTPDPPF